METLFEEPRCLFCRAVLKGRSDKKFCNPDHKNKFHNPRNRVKNQVFKDLDKKLHKNNAVLAQFYDKSNGIKRLWKIRISQM